MRTEATLALLLLAAPALAAETLTGEQVKAEFFTGKPFTGVARDGARYTLVFKPDGTMSRSPLDAKGTPATGTWRLSGNSYCAKWSDQSSENCPSVEKTDAKTWTLKVRGFTAGTWSK